jgi:hypothetical protein
VVEKLSQGRDHNPVLSRLVSLPACYYYETLSVQYMIYITTSMEITNQLPLLATYRVFTVHKSYYMFRLYSHPQVYHVYKNAKIIIKT